MPKLVTRYSNLTLPTHHTSPAKFRFAYNLQVIAGLAKIADYAKANDPETTKHATHVTTDSNNPFTVVAIEEYTSQAACDAHSNWPPVLEFLEDWKANPNRLSGAPQIWHSTRFTGFGRAPMATAEDPYVVLATLKYASEADAEKGVELWKVSVDATERDEQETLAYVVGKGIEHPSQLTFAEAYESEKFFRDVHMKSDGLLKAVEADKERKPEMQLWMLKKVAGYLHK